MSAYTNAQREEAELHKCVFPLSSRNNQINRYLPTKATTNTETLNAFVNIQ